MKKLLFILIAFAAISINAQEYIGEELRLGVTPLANDSDLILANGTHNGFTNVVSKTQITVGQLTTIAAPTLQSVTNQGNTSTNQLIINYIGSAIGGANIQTQRFLEASRTNNARSFWDNSTLENNTNNISYASYDANVQYNNNTMGHAISFQSRPDFTDVIFTEEIEGFTDQSYIMNNVTAPLKTQFYAKSPSNFSNNDIDVWSAFEVENREFPGEEKYAFRSLRSDMHALFGGYLQANDIRVSNGSNHVSIKTPDGLIGDVNVTAPSIPGQLVVNSQLPNVDNFVTKTTNENISGVKTFSVPIQFSNFSSNVVRGAQGGIYQNGQGLLQFYSGSQASPNEARNFVIDNSELTVDKRNYKLQDEDGTLAHLENLVDYLPLSGGNITGNTNISGNVGIGTTLPGQTVVINSSNNATGQGDNSTQLKLQHNASTNGAASGINFGVSANIAFTGAKIAHIRNGSNSVGDLVFYTRSSAGSITDFDLTEERVRIESSGRLNLSSVLKLARLASDPTSGNEQADIYWNTTNSEVRVYNGTTWRALAFQ